MADATLTFSIRDFHAIAFGLGELAGKSPRSVVVPASKVRSSLHRTDRTQLTIGKPKPYSHAIGSPKAMTPQQSRYALKAPGRVPNPGRIPGNARIIPRPILHFPSQLC